MKIYFYIYTLIKDLVLTFKLRETANFNLLKVFFRVIHSLLIQTLSWLTYLEKHKDYVEPNLNYTSLETRRCRLLIGNPAVYPHLVDFSRELNYRYWSRPTQLRISKL